MSTSRRPAVAVVMPFAGNAEAARRALATLAGLDTQEGDELVLADNSDSAPAAGLGDGSAVRVVRVPGERSPAHARNVGARMAGGDWILFLDADVEAPSGLIGALFDPPPERNTGAVAGEIIPAPGGRGLAERYAAARNPLSQRAHLAHPFRPRVAAANLLVRRAAFDGVGGFLEGLRAAEDTDLSWRLQDAGWQLELRPGALVAHRYRTTVGQLRRQWRGYAAGRAWLGRRYAGFTPQPAAARVVRRVVSRAQSRPGPAVAAPAVVPTQRRPLSERAAFLALDTVLAGEELIGLALSNRPQSADLDRRVGVVWVTERLLEPGADRGPARVEARARPDHPVADYPATIFYAEDEGPAVRLWALFALIQTHPRRVLADRRGRRAGDLPLAVLAPAVHRLRRDPPETQVGSSPEASAQRTAERLRALSGRSGPEDR